MRGGLTPPGLHSGAGSQAYTFIWGMCARIRLDVMDGIATTDLM